MNTCPKCGKPLDSRRRCATHGWQPKPFPADWCPHCNGSGQLISTVPDKPYRREGDRLVPNAAPGAKARTCNFCGGTGLRGEDKL